MDHQSEYRKHIAAIVREANREKDAGMWKAHPRWKEVLDVTATLPATVASHAHVRWVTTASFPSDPSPYLEFVKELKAVLVTSGATPAVVVERVSMLFAGVGSATALAWAWNLSPPPGMPRLEVIGGGLRAAC